IFQHLPADSEEMLTVGIHLQIERAHSLAVELDRSLLDQAARGAARARHPARHREIDDARRGGGSLRLVELATAELLEILRRFAPAELRLEVSPRALRGCRAVIHRHDTLAEALLHQHRIHSWPERPR